MYPRMGSQDGNKMVDVFLVRKKIYSSVVYHCFDISRQYYFRNRSMPSIKSSPGKRVARSRYGRKVEDPPSKNPSEAPSYQAPTAPLILTQRVIKFLIPGRGNKERLLRATLKFDLVAYRRKVRTGSHSRHDRDDFRFERP